ncbi:cysteine ABC transporter substrate-binding protein [Enterococcus hirae]|nr:cysteine ABC transporter substrate-binding protein [Enterococcus hirae]
MKRKWLNVLLLAGIVAVLAACGNASSEDKSSGDASDNAASVAAIKKRGKLRVAVFGDKAPFGYIDKDGKNQGYDIYLAKRLAKDLLGDENKVEFVVTEAQNRVDVLKSNKVDITLANFTVTDERKEQVDFANPYMKVAIGVASPKSAPITSVKQLEGKTLLVNKGTTAEIYFAKKYPDIKQQKYDQNTETFEALKDGRGAALAHDNTLLYAWVKENPDFEVGIKELGSVDYIAPAVKKGNKDLLKWLNTELERLGKENFFHQDYDATLKPYFSDDITADDVVVEGKAEK